MKLPNIIFNLLPINITVGYYWNKVVEAAEYQQYPEMMKALKAFCLQLQVSLKVITCDKDLLVFHLLVKYEKK